jgi:hypothetical protein
MRQNYAALVQYMLAMDLYSAWRVLCRRLHKNEHVVGWPLHTQGKVSGEGQYALLPLLLNTRKSANTTGSYISMIL